jgi:hypothetical protein
MFRIQLGYPGSFILRFSEFIQEFVELVLKSEAMDGYFVWDIL